MATTGWTYTDAYSYTTAGTSTTDRNGYVSFTWRNPWEEGVGVEIKEEIKKQKNPLIEIHIGAIVRMRGTSDELEVKEIRGDIFTDTNDFHHDAREAILLRTKYGNEVEYID